MFNAGRFVGKSAATAEVVPGVPVE